MGKKILFEESKEPGFTNISIPINPIKIPSEVSIENFVFFIKNKDIKKVKRGIVPMSVEAMTLSTQTSLQLIKLKGSTFPNKAIINKSALFSRRRILIFSTLQKKYKNMLAIISLYEVKRAGWIVSTLIFIKINELPQIADSTNKENIVINELVFLEMNRVKSYYLFYIFPKPH